MAEFPKDFFYADPLIHVSTIAPCVLGNTMFSTGIPASAVYPSANLAIFVPFRISRPYVFNTFFWMNGTVVSGNIDAGVYSSDGTRIISAGTTLQAGVSATQTVSVSSTELGAGLFYLAYAMNNTTGTLMRQNPNFNICRALGMMAKATSFVLPATVALTALATAQNYIALMGITNRSVV